MGEKKKDVVVPSSTTDGKDKSDDDDEKKSTKTTGKDAKPEIELSEEDLQLKTNLELLVQRGDGFQSGRGEVGVGEHANGDQNGDEVRRITRSTISFL